MTVLRQQALQMLEEVPDEQISYVIAFCVTSGKIKILQMKN